MDGRKAEGRRDGRIISQNIAGSYMKTSEFGDEDRRTKIKERTFRCVSRATSGASSSVLIV